MVLTKDMKHILNYRIIALSLLRIYGFERYILTEKSQTSLRDIIKVKKQNKSVWILTGLFCL